MLGTKILLTFLAALAALGAEFSGTSALEYTRRVVEFGPRPPGSPAIRKLQAYILAQARARGAVVEEDGFTAQTPVGSIAMKNIVARFPGSSGRAVVITGHYDTKHMPEIRFVGANDGGASAGFLLEMARTLAGRKLTDSVWLVWFDGEEAFGEWSATDGIYGSRHLAAEPAARLQDDHGRSEPGGLDGRGAAAAAAPDHDHVVRGRGDCVVAAGIFRGREVRRPLGTAIVPIGEAVRVRHRPVIARIASASRAATGQ